MGAHRAGSAARTIAEPMTAAPFLPDARSLGALRKAAATCRGCPLYRNATQTVFGAGPAKRARDARR